MARRDRLASGRRALNRTVMAVAVIMTVATRTWADTVLVPSLSVASRYDSNVFFLPEGDLADYVTSITPGLRVEHRGRMVEGSVNVNVMGELYLKNPGLNYIGTTDSASLNLDQIVGRLDRRAHLTVMDSFTFTPQPPGFLAPETGSTVPPEFIRGVQTWRRNSLMNVATGSAWFGLTQASRIRATYQNMYTRFANAFLPEGPGNESLVGQSPFFTTVYQVMTAGPEIDVTKRDVATATAQFMDMQFTGGRETTRFQTKGGLVGWKRGLTKEFTANGAVGLTLLTPGNSLQYLANGTLEWRRRDTAANIGYSRTVFPSFFVAAAPLLSQNFSVSGSHKLSQFLTANASAGYAFNETISGPTVSFESYMISIGVSYIISRTLTASASYSHSEFYYGFGEDDFAFNRDVIQFVLRKEWR